MNIQYHFININNKTKEKLKEYSAKRFSHLDKFLSSFPEDSKMLTLTIEHHKKHNSYEIRSSLLLGGKTINHNEVTHNPEEAIDKSEANIIRQAKKYIDFLHHHKNQKHNTTVNEPTDMSEEY